MQVSECFAFAWRTFWTNARAFVLLGAVLMLAKLAIDVLLVLALKELGVALSYASTGLVWGSTVDLASKTAQGQRPTLSVVLAALKQAPITHIMVGIAMATGYVACGIGIFVSATLFLFAPVFVVDGATLRVALARSKQLALANRGESLLLVVCLAGLGALGFAAFVVGTLFTLPFMALVVVKATELGSRHLVPVSAGGYRV
jgi:hypothetical protein